MSAVLDTPLDSKPLRKNRKLTPAEKQIIVAACAMPGAVKGKIAKDFDIQPETISRILKDAKLVKNDSNPLSHDYKPALKLDCIASLHRGINDRKDPQAAGALALKTMYGIGEFVDASKVSVEGSVNMVVSWQSRKQAVIEEAAAIDVESENPT